MYHITKRKHLPSILIHGIIPGKRKGIFVQSKKLKHVYITNNIEKILYTHCGEKYFKKHDLVILHINMEGLEYKPVKYIDGMTYTISDYEFICNKIEKERIIKIDEITLFT